MLVLMLVLTMGITSTSSYAKENSDLESIVSELKEQGISDDQIKLILSDKESNLASSDDFEISTQYYRVPDNGQDKPVSISRNEAIIGASAYNMVSQEYKESLSNIPSLCAQDDQKSQDGYLMQSIIVNKESSTKVRITYNANWLKRPKNQKTDAYGVAFSNANLTSDSVLATYYWKIDRYTKSGSLVQANWKSGSQNISGSVFRGTSGAAVTCDMIDDTLDLVQRVNYNHMYLNCYARVTSGAKYVYVSGYYKHQEFLYAVSPSISGIGLTAGLGLSYSSHFNNMTPNPYIEFKWN